MEVAGIVVGLLMVAALVWLIVEVRTTRDQLQPLISAPIVQTLSRVGT